MPISRIETNSIAPSQTLTTPIIATTMGVGGATPSGSGSGITFPATQSASTDANTLDDYEEGTFTPTIGGSSTAGTGTYGTNGQIGRYQKVGNRCYFTIWLQWTNLSGAGGVLYALGLPFTSSTSPNAYYAITAYMDGTITLNASSVFQAYVINASTSIFLSQYTSGGSAAAGITLDSNAAIMLTGHYEVA
jgi:hypothetical protein